MSQDLLKRAINNKPKVLKCSCSKCYIFSLKGLIFFEFYDHEVSGILVLGEILISVSSICAQILVTLPPSKKKENK